MISLEEYRSLPIDRSAYEDVLRGVGWAVDDAVWRAGNGIVDRAVFDVVSDAVFEAVWRAVNRAFQSGFSRD